jgi:uncharacterized protein YlxW (UPF0749 family)
MEAGSRGGLQKELRLKSGQLAIGVVCVLLGFMLAVQVRTQQDLLSDLSRVRTAELTSYVKSLEKERDNLQAQMADLRVKVAELIEGRSLISTLQTDLETVRGFAGLTEVRGPGITVIMDDSKKLGKPGQDPNAFIIHDDDVLKLINELLASGAEALSINGQRYVATTEVRCVGPTISINNTRTAPPIVVHAIGNPQTLDAGLRMRGGIVESLSFWGISVTVKVEEEVYIPAYKGGFRFEYAKPVTKRAGDK